MPIEWFQYPVMVPSIQRSNIFEWHPNWTDLMYDKWLWFCALWQTNLSTFWQQQLAHGDDDLEFGPIQCLNPQYESSHPLPFRVDRLVLLGMDIMLHGNLRKSFSREFSIDHLGKILWRLTCTHCHPVDKKQKFICYVVSQ